MASAVFRDVDWDIQSGTIRFAAITLPSSCVANANVSATAAIAADKLEHRVRKGYSQPNTTPTAETRTIHVVQGATATVNSFKAGSIAAASSGSLTVDLKKNGSSILSAAITLDSGNTNRVMESATISSASLVAGDWLEIVIAVSSHNGTGLFVQIEIDEDAA